MATTTKKNTELKKHSRIIIESLSPNVDLGRFPVKRSLGEIVIAKAIVLCDGHDKLYTNLLYRHTSETEWHRLPMKNDGNDIWTAEFCVEKLGEYLFTVESGFLNVKAKLLPSKAHPEEKSNIQFSQNLIVDVDPPYATNSAWYEFFPRSTSEVAGKHGTLASSTKHLEYVAGMGFNVVYLPPIYPIGKQFRKGINNAITALPNDVGSPWAIGGKEGGFTSILPELGTMTDFKHFVDKATALKMKVALDIAFQCSPDHPYVTNHSEWFRKRPDGTIQYAENPPKKYQDIYPFDFECENKTELWQELKSVILFWIKHGIQIFRVDNPHTKPFQFWEWLIKEVRHKHPEVIFLAEAFSRSHIMQYLAKIGFNQSYTYFTWRNTKKELIEYMTELTTTNMSEYYRPNFWPNTPDILPKELQTGSRAAFIRRVVLASTLSSNYGIYGPAFELCEATPRDVGGEEYFNSEKYEVKNWNIDNVASLAPLIATLNKIRNENVALASNRQLQFLDIPNENLLAYVKKTEDNSNIILVVVNLSSTEKTWGMLTTPLEELGLEPGVPFCAHDLLTGVKYKWENIENYIELDPNYLPAHIFRIEKGIS